MENLFSQIKSMKTDNRACLKQESLLALIRSKKQFLSKESACDFASKIEPPSDMTRLHSNMIASEDDNFRNKLRQIILEDL